MFTVKPIIVWVPLFVSITGFSYPFEEAASSINLLNLLLFILNLLAVFNHRLKLSSVCESEVAQMM